MYQQSGLGLWVGIALSVIVHVGGAAGWYMFVKDDRPKIQLNNIQAAVLVRKGIPRPKHLLPRIFQPKNRPQPRRRVVKPKPNQRTKPQRRRREVVDLDKSLEKRIEEYRRRRQERDPRAEDAPPPGQADGDVRGTAEKARQGSMYAAKVGQRITDNLNFPSFWTPDQISACKSKFLVNIFISSQGDLVERRTNVVRDADRLCKNSVLTAIKRAAPFPAPPSKIFPNGVSITVRLAE